MWPASRKFRLERRAARAFGLKDYSSAIQALEELLSVVGENPNTLHVLAICRQRRGEHEYAIAAAERGLAADAEHVSCLKVLAETHADCGNTDTAREYALRALALLDARARTATTLIERVQRVLHARGDANTSDPEDREWKRWARALCESAEDSDKEDSSL